MTLQLRALAAATAIIHLSAMCLATPVQAEVYPSRPIHIYVGFGPGSTADILARLVGKSIESQLGQPVVVENHSGDASMSAAESVARASKDGYTLFLGTVANTINPTQMHSSFRLNKDMDPIALLGIVPNVLVAHPSLPANNVRELIDLARKIPESLTFGSSGIGTANDLAAQLFNQKAGTKLVIVPYSGGSSQATTDLLANRIQLMFGQAQAFKPYVEAGALKALGVGQSTRTPILPNVPTMDEAGMPGFEVGIWMGLLAPAGTPADTIKTLSGAANKAVQSETMATAMKAQAIDPMAGTSTEFADFISRDIEKWSALLASTGSAN